MAPKKEIVTPKGNKTGGTHTHATYQDMIMDAILALKDRNGSGRPSLKKYVRNNNDLGAVSDKMFDALFNKALKAGVDKGTFHQPKGPSGGTKAAKKPVVLKAVLKPDVKKPEVKKPVAVKEKALPKEDVKEKSTPKKEAPKEKTVTKRAAAPAKKATRAAPVKKAAAVKQATPKKPASKPVKKTSAKPEAPAVVLHKTKSGRVTKSIPPPPQYNVTPKKRTVTPKPRSAKVDKASA